MGADVNGRCMFKGCMHAAHYAPRLSVPARGWRDASGKAHAPLEVFVGLEVCARHFDEIAAVDLLHSDALRVDVTASLLNSHRAAPDFAHAWIDKVSINSAEYIAHKAIVRRMGMA
jgi:hypothetical protein